MVQGHNACTQHGPGCGPFGCMFRSELELGPWPAFLMPRGTSPQFQCLPRQSRSSSAHHGVSHGLWLWGQRGCRRVALTPGRNLTLGSLFLGASLLSQGSR